MFAIHSLDCFGNAIYQKEEKNRLTKLHNLDIENYRKQADMALKRHTLLQYNIFSLLATVIATSPLERRVRANTRISLFFEMEMLCFWIKENWKKNLGMTKEDNSNV